MDEQSCPIHVLAVSPVEADLVILANLIGHSAWTFESCPTADAAGRRIAEGDIQVVLTDAQLPDADWKNILQLSSTVESPPAVVVLSRGGDERLWAEVLNLGAWDVLVKPFRAKEVYRTVHTAWRHWTDTHRPRRAVGRAETAPGRIRAVAGTR